METVSQVCPSVMYPRRRLRHTVVALLALLVVGLSVGERPAIAWDGVVEKLVVACDSGD